MKYTGEIDCLLKIWTLIGSRKHNIELKTMVVEEYKRVFNKPTAEFPQLTIQLIQKKLT